MSHEIESNLTGGERFAYNAENGDPWHRLGIGIQGYGTLEEMLAAAAADFTITQVPLHLEDGTEVTSHVANVRQEVDFQDGDFVTVSTILGVVGKGYEVETNRQAAEFALECVGAGEGDAVFDTMGVIKGGREFFTYIDLGAVTIDPLGVGDVVKRGLCVRNSHDGSLSLAAFPTNTRVVCNNTLTWSYNEASRAKQVHRVRHTKNKDAYKADAVQAMGLARQLQELFVKQATKLVFEDGGHDVLDRVIHELYEAPTNQGGFGDSGWTVWNTVVEFLDHKRGRSQADTRALASMDPDSAVSKLKDKAAAVLLAV